MWILCFFFTFEIARSHIFYNHVYGHRKVKFGLRALSSNKIQIFSVHLKWVFFPNLTIKVYF